MRRAKRRAVSRTSSSNARFFCVRRSRGPQSSACAGWGFAGRRAGWVARRSKQSQKGSLFGRRKMADLENDIEMRSRNRRRIGGLRCAKRSSGSCPSASASLWRVPEGRGRDVAQYGLVCFDLRGLRVAGGASFIGAPPIDRPRRSPLWPPERGELTERARRPAVEERFDELGSPPASPHRLTFRRTLAP